MYPLQKGGTITHRRTVQLPMTSESLLAQLYIHMPCVHINLYTNITVHDYLHLILARQRGSPKYSKPFGVPFAEALPHCGCYFLNTNGPTFQQSLPRKHRVTFSRWFLLDFWFTFISSVETGSEKPYGFLGWDGFWRLCQGMKSTGLATQLLKRYKYISLPK